MVWYASDLGFPPDKVRSSRYNFIFGLVAQLGERSVRIREVEGSNPFRSTKMKTTQKGGFHFGAELGIRDLSPTYYCTTTWENKKP